MVKTAIVNVAVFDGLDRMGPTTVVLSDGVVATVDQAASTTQMDVVIDGTGHTILPGFIDCHVHTDTQDGLREFPPFGITTLLDMGTPEDVTSLREASKVHSNRLPTYMSAGPPAIAPGSHHARLVPEDGLVSSQAQAEAFVAARVASGSDYIKVVADFPGFDQPTLNLLANAARRAGKMSIAHAARTDSYTRAILANFDVLTHVPFDGLLEDATIEALKQNNTFVVPTTEMMRHLCITRYKDNPAFKADIAVQNLGKLHAAGIPICVGTDANHLPPPMYLGYGKTYGDELRLMVEAGMSTIEALRAATSGPAENFSFEDRGYISPGKRADLVLVEGDPVENISAATNVKRVWIAGEQVHPLQE